MRKKIVRLATKPFVRNVLIMGGGSAAGQLITILMSPVITRLYGPEAYGQMGIFISFCFLVIPAAALTYPVAIVLADDDAEARGLAKISLRTSVGVALFVAAVLYLFSDEIMRVFQLEPIASVVYLIPFVILFSGYLQILEQWLIRQEQFLVTAKVEVLQALALQGSRVGIGSFFPTSFVLIVSWSIGLAFKSALMHLFFHFPGNSRMSFVKEPGVSLSKIAKKYKDFPLFRTPQILLYSLSETLPLLLLASFFGAAAAGFYSIGRTVLNVPVNLISKAVADVFYQRFAMAAENKENLPALIIKTSLALGAVGILPFGVIVLLGPQVFMWVFGAEWVTAGEYGRWLALWLFFVLLAKPATAALPVLAAQRFHLGYTVFMIFVWVGGLSIGAYVFGSEEITVAIFGISGAVLNLLLVVLTLVISQRFQESGISKK